MVGPEEEVIVPDIVVPLIVPLPVIEPDNMM
jgi:hypothetical protein